MKLTATKRAEMTKGACKKARRSGKIPANVYAPGEVGQAIEVDGAEYDAALRQLKPGHLATTVFELELDGKKKKVLVKEVQYDLTSYRVIHLDLIELKNDVPVKVSVPIECIGIDQCVGIKLGGSMRQVIRSVKVQCLPEKLPNSFQIDIRNLKIKQAKRLSDLTMPEGVKPVTPMNEVVVVIAKR